MGIQGKETFFLWFVATYCAWLGACVRIKPLVCSCNYSNDWSLKICFCNNNKNCHLPFWRICPFVYNYCIVSYSECICFLYSSQCCVQASDDTQALHSSVCKTDIVFYTLWPTEPVSNTKVVSTHLKAEK